MKREGLKKHWDIIEAFKNGEETEFYNKTLQKWELTDYPNFHSDIEYRIKPFEPTPGDWISVTNNPKEGVYRKRLFVGMYGSKYACLIGSGNSKIIYETTHHDIEVVSWLHAKPVKK